MCPFNKRAALCSMAMALFIALAIMLSAGCQQKTATGSLFPDAVFTLDNAKQTVHTLNSVYVPAHKAYSLYYANASKERQLLLNKTVNKVVNEATDSLVNLTSAIMTWELLNQTPKDIDKLILNTSASVNSAVETIEEVTKED